MSAKLIKQEFGEKIVLGVVGENREDVELELNALYNWGVFGPDRAMQNEWEASWQSDTFAYGWTTEERLLSGMTHRAENILLDRPGVCKFCTNKKRGIRPLARRLAEKRINSIPSENFFSGIYGK